MGRIMVEIYIAKGFMDEILIEWRGQKYHYPLDYWGVPFRCKNCKAIGHLCQTCKSTRSRSTSEETSNYYGDWYSKEYNDADGSEGTNPTHLPPNNVSHGASNQNMLDLISKIKAMDPTL